MEEEFNFIKRALEIARESKRKGLRPFGAVLVNDKQQIVMEAFDMRDDLSDPTAHPEIYLISTYCRKVKKQNLKGYSIYTNIEPCSMCSGAIRSSRISKVVFSVPQSILRKYSGGKTKINSQDILKYSRGEIIVKGLILLEEGISIIKGYNFNKSYINVK
ncbi:MAG: tRNA-specific adenosine deaminase [Flavobacterium sp.]|nr:MAG: tRNA-specific adenosine deaminase [Flavobacterium sp.]